MIPIFGVFLFPIFAGKLRTRQEHKAMTGIYLAVTRQNWGGREGVAVLIELNSTITCLFGARGNALRLLPLRMTIEKMLPCCIVEMQSEVITAHEGVICHHAPSTLPSPLAFFARRRIFC